MNHRAAALVAWATLYTAGLLAPRDAQMAGGMPSARVDPPQAESGRIWTPGQDAPAPSGGKSAIWTP